MAGDEEFTLVSSPNVSVQRPTPADVVSLAGAFGYVAVDGTTDFAVVIRTLVIQGSGASFFRSWLELSLLTLTFWTDLTLGAGGAITHLSVPESEWEEVLVKKDAVVSQL